MEKEAWREEKKALIKRYHEENMTAEKGGIVLAGSSLMEMFPADKWINESGITPLAAYNRGVGGYTTRDYLPVIDICVNELMPSKVFINIGTNDLSDERIPISEMISRYDQILAKIITAVPSAKIYMMAYYPVNEIAADDRVKAWLKVRSNAKIALANGEVKKLALKRGHEFIDINAPLKDEDGRLKAEYTIEGMHINENGYRAIFGLLTKYVLE